MMATWYVLEDGSVGDPSLISPDEKGVLRHRDGRAVAYAPHGPRSRMVDAEAERANVTPVPMTHNEKRAANGLPPVEDGPVIAPSPVVEREAVSPEDRELRPKRRGKRYETR